MAVDHVGIQVSNLETSREFYAKALAPLGLAFIKEVGGYLGFGAKGYPEFWLGVQSSKPQGTHVGFLAEDRATVRRFFQEAVQAGGIPRSEPKIFDIYHQHFYAAMVFDPDGHNIEVVCHKPEQ